MRWLTGLLISTILLLASCTVFKTKQKSSSKLKTETNTEFNAQIQNEAQNEFESIKDISIQETETSRLTIYTNGRPFKINDRGEFVGEADSIRRDSRKDVNTNHSSRDRGSSSQKTESDVSGSTDKSDLKEDENLDLEVERRPNIVPYIGMALFFTIIICVTVVIFKLKSPVP